MGANDDPQGDDYQVKDKIANDIQKARNKERIHSISIKQSMEISNPTVPLCRGLQRGDHLHRPLRVRAHGHVQESFRNQRPRTHGYHSHTDQGVFDTRFMVYVLI